MMPIPACPVPGGNCYLCFTHIINVAYYSLDTVYLVFNDAGTSIPVALPNASLQEKDYLNNIQSSQAVRTTVFASICQGQNYTGHTTLGTYVDTLTSSVNGCDSIRTLHLTIKPVFNTTVTASICQGQNYAGHTATGTYVDVYTATNGCDSTRTLHLDVRPAASTTINASICPGQNYEGYTSAGTYVDVYTAANGCDSTRTLQLTVKPIFNTTINAMICEGENYAGYTAPGTYVDVLKAANGCDSTRTLNLTVNPVKFTTVTAFICSGENYAGHVTSGTYVDVYSTIFGCDSTRTLHLTVKATVSTHIAIVICEGENYAGHTVSGTYTDVFTGQNGCDSSRTLELTVHPVQFTNISAEICDGASYFAAGDFQTAAGIYRDTAQTWLGCDSIITTNLKIIPLPAPNLGPDQGLCIGDVLTIEPGNFSSYLWHNGSINSSFTTNIAGTYSVMVTNSFGCKAADTIKISTYNDCIPIQIPNAFTPNKDGKNDVFRPVIHGLVSNYQMRLWNRWGQQVFETRNIREGWDGLFKSVEQSTDVYVYMITFKDRNSKEIKKYGTVVLIR